MSRTNGQVESDMSRTNDQVEIEFSEKGRGTSQGLICCIALLYIEFNQSKAISLPAELLKLED